MNPSGAFDVHSGIPFLTLLVLAWLGLMYWTRKEARRYPVSVGLGAATTLIVFSYLYTMLIAVNYLHTLEIVTMLAYLAVIPLVLAGLLGIAWLLTYVTNIVRGGMTFKAHVAQVHSIAILLAGLVYLRQL